MQITGIINFPPLPSSKFNWSIFALFATIVKVVVVVVMRMENALNAVAFLRTFHGSVCI